MDKMVLLLLWFGRVAENFSLLGLHILEFVLGLLSPGFRKLVSTLRYYRYYII